MQHFFCCSLDDLRHREENVVVNNKVSESLTHVFCCDVRMRIMIAENSSVSHYEVVYFQPLTQIPPRSQETVAILFDTEQHHYYVNLTVGFDFIREHQACSGGKVIIKNSFARVKGGI